jgi:hypothetical protein
MQAVIPLELLHKQEFLSLQETAHVYATVINSHRDGTSISGGDFFPGELHRD